MTITAPFFKLSFKEHCSVSDGFGSFPHIQHGPVSAATPWEFRWLYVFVEAKQGPQTWCHNWYQTLWSRPVWTAPPTSLKSLDDPLLRGEALETFGSFSFWYDWRVMIDEENIAGIAWPKQSICALRLTELRGASFPHCADVTVASRWLCFLIRWQTLHSEGYEVASLKHLCPPTGLKNQAVGRTSSVRSWEFLNRMDFLRFRTLEASHFHDVWVVHSTWIWNFQFGVRTTCRDAFPKYMQVPEAPAFPTGDKRPCLEFAAEITAGWQYRTMRRVDTVAQALTTSAKHWQCDE